MSELDRELLRKLAEWDTHGAPVYSLYLDVDGRRYPREQDYLLRAQELCRRMGERATALHREDAADGVVRHDTGRMMMFLERDFERAGTRGVALFSCSAANLWEEILLTRPVRDRAAVAEAPYLLPLEALIETYESFCTVLVDRSRARIFLAERGGIQERTDVFDELPRRHDQGGRAQSRLQRHVDELAERHLRHVCDVLLRFFKRKGFDHLIVAGPEEIVPEFERCLHDYLRRRIVARETMAVTASATKVLERSLEIEKRRDAERERRTLDHLQAEAAAGRGAVVGLAPTLDALNDGRVDTLVVPLGTESRGTRCIGCERLSAADGRCASCGAEMEPVPDVLESALAAALRQGCRIETLSSIPEQTGLELGALLRF